MGDWRFVVFTIAMILVGGLGVLLIYRPRLKKHKVYTNNVQNYDSLMRRFVYKVKMNRQEILLALELRNVQDELKCTLDVANSKIIFVDDDLGYRPPIGYVFSIDEMDGFSILRLEQEQTIHSSKDIPLKLNAFMVRKLKAEIVPYKEYGI